jgi:hypothetical protein
MPASMQRLTPVRALLPIRALAVIVSVAVFSAGGNALAQSRPNTAFAPEGDLEVLQIRSNFYMVAGAGGNIAVQVGTDGVVLVDTGVGAAADSVVAAVRRVTPSPIRLPPEDDGCFQPLNHDYRSPVLPGDPTTDVVGGNRWQTSTEEKRHGE